MCSATKPKTSKHFFIPQFRTKGKDDDPTLEPSSRRDWGWGQAHSQQCAVRSTVVLKPSPQRGPDTVLSDQNITLGIWTKGQVEPVRQLVSKMLFSSGQALGS